jgi:hypothetical protein
VTIPQGVLGESDRRHMVAGSEEEPIVHAGAGNAYCTSKTPRLAAAMRMQA